MERGAYNGKTDRLLFLIEGLSIFRKFRLLLENVRIQRLPSPTLAYPNVRVLRVELAANSCLAILLVAYWYTSSNVT